MNVDIRLSHVYWLNAVLRKRNAERKRERKFQRMMYNRLLRFAIDEAEGVLEEWSKIDKNREDERS